jgi:hypothetical protein
MAFETSTRKGDQAYEASLTSTNLSKLSIQNLNMLRTSDKSSLLVDSDGSGMRQVEEHFGGDLLKIQDTDEIFVDSLPDEINYAMRMGFPMLIDIECFADRSDLLLWLLKREQHIYKRGRFFISLDGLEWAYDPMFQVFLYSSYAGSETFQGLTQEALDHLTVVDCLQEFSIVEFCKCQILPLQINQSPLLDDFGMISVSCFNLAGERKCQLSVKPWDTKVCILRGLIARHLAWLCPAIILVFPVKFEIASLDANIGELLCSH